MPDDEPNRREVLQAAGAATLGGTLSALSASEAAARRVVPEAADRGHDAFAVEREQATEVFPQSVASGGPTASGVLLWTRIRPDAYDGDTPLGVEVAEDEAFQDTVYRGIVTADTFDARRDHAVTVDVDGELDAGNEYVYRFVYGGDASRIGRCRTLPAPDASPESVRFAVASCNNYLHGYFGAFGHIAEEDADFLVHLGDLIYEYAGDDVRSIELPSGNRQAHGLDDYRHLYRTYRSDEYLQRALRNHTLIHTWDDHEVVADRWWNYETDAPETENHPQGGDPEFMRQLYVDAIRAYTEYVPVRATYEPQTGESLSPDSIQENFQLYRSFEFGDLLDLFVTDERLYRSPPPQDETSGPSVPVEVAVQNPGRTMLGRDQREWLVEGMTDSDAQWKLWGNEVLAAAFRFIRSGGAQVNADAWDGYRTERENILTQLSEAGVENVVALTGDMHSYLAAYLTTGYELAPSVRDGSVDGSSRRTGVEFMAPAISSDNLVALGQLPDVATQAFVAALRAENPHVEWFDSSHWGYATVEVGRDELVYSAYAVDRSVEGPDVPRELLRRFRVPEGSVDIQRVDDGGGGGGGGGNSTNDTSANDTSAGNTTNAGNSTDNTTAGDSTGNATTGNDTTGGNSTSAGNGTNSTSAGNGTNSTSAGNETNARDDPGGD